MLFLVSWPMCVQSGRKNKTVYSRSELFNMCHKGRVSLDTKCTLQDLGLYLGTTRGKRSGARKQRQIVRRVTVHGNSDSISGRQYIPANLIKITSNQSKMRTLITERREEIERADQVIKCASCTDDFA